MAYIFRNPHWQMDNQLHIVILFTKYLWHPGYIPVQIELEFAVPNHHYHCPSMVISPVIVWKAPPVVLTVLSVCYQWTLNHII